MSVAEIHQLKPKANTKWMCSACGIDAACDCGAPLMSKAQLVRDAIQADPGRPNRQIARETGADRKQVQRERAKLRGGDMSPPISGFVEAWNDETRRVLEDAADPIEEACTDCVNDEERWQRSLSNMAGDAVSLSSYWMREFGQWDQFVVPRELATLATQAAEAWKQIASKLNQRIK